MTPAIALNGRAIPQLGFGVFQFPPGRATQAAVAAALEAGSGMWTPLPASATRGRRAHGIRPRVRNPAAPLAARSLSGLGVVVSPTAGRDHPSWERLS